MVSKGGFDAGKTIKTAFWFSRIDFHFVTGFYSFVRYLHGGHKDFLYCEKQGYKLPVFCTFDRVAGLNFNKDKQGRRKQVKDNNDGEALPQVTILKDKGENQITIEDDNLSHSIKDSLSYPEKRWIKNNV